MFCLGFASVILLETQKTFKQPCARISRMGRETTTEQSLGKNVAELVGWAYRGAHETSNQWKGFT